MFLMGISGSEGSWTTGAIPGDATDGLLVNLGSNNDVVVTNAGTFAVQVDGAALTALQLIDNLVLAEDAAHQSGDVGVQMLAVRDDTLNIRSGAENDYEPLHTNANGALWSIDVNSADFKTALEAIQAAVEGTLTVGSHAVTNAGTFAVQVDGSALTALQLIDDTVYVDDADWTDNTSKHLLVGGVYQGTPHTVTDGDVTPFLTDANGRLAVTVNGTVTVGSHAVTNAGTFAVQVDGDALTALQNIDTDLTTIIGHVDGIEGLLTTIDGDTGNIVTAVQLIDNLVLAEDAAHQSGDAGVQLLAVRDDGLNVRSGTDGDYEPLHTDSSGALWTDEIHAAAISAAVEIMDDWDESDRAKVNPIAGQAGVQGGSGTVTALTQRVVLATDVALPAGTNAIGKLAANSGVDIGDVDVTSAVTGTMDHISNRDIDTTAEQITATSFATKFGVIIRADPANSGILYIGNSDVTAGTTAATDGIPLEAGDSIFLPLNNINIPYAIGSVANQVVYIMGV